MSDDPARMSDAPDMSAGTALHLNHALWVEADKALALALLDSHELRLALDTAITKSGPAASEALEPLEAAALLSIQSIARSADIRGLAISGVVGERLEFDPSQHVCASDDVIKPGTLVCVLRPAIIRKGPPVQLMTPMLVEVIKRTPATETAASCEQAER